MPLFIDMSSSGVGNLVPRLSFGIVIHLSNVCLPQADRKDIAAAHCKHQSMEAVFYADLSTTAKALCQPLQEISKQLIAALSVVAVTGLSKQRT